MSMASWIGSSTKSPRVNHDPFAICLCKVFVCMCLLYQAMNPQIRKGSSHARPLQRLHGNPHNQWQSINGLAPLLSTRTKPLEVSGCKNEHLQTCWARREIFKCSLDWCHTGPHCHAHARRALGSGGENICPQALLQEHPKALCGTLACSSD